MHVRGLSEVFIADWQRSATDEYVAACCSSRAPTACGATELSDYHDPVVTLEIGRQTVFYVLHHHYEIPGDWKFVLKRIDFQLVDVEAYRDDRISPPEGSARVRLESKTQ